MFGNRASRSGSVDMPADPYAAEREAMIEQQLRRRGVVMHSVLEALCAVPRHLFVSHDYMHRAYADEALPSLEGQTISQPFMVAVMTQELAITHPRAYRVLEVGTGTGYQTAVLAHLVALQHVDGMVYTIERVASLAEFARHRLEAMDFRNVRYFVGDGSAGWPPDDSYFEGKRSPDGLPLFDRILVTAGAPEIPQPLLGQLADGGIMVVPVGDSESQVLMRITKRGTEVDTKELFACRFVPLLGTFAWDTAEYERQARERDG